MVDGYVKRRKFGRKQSKQFKRMQLDSERIKSMQLDDTINSFQAEIIDVVVSNGVFLAIHDPESKTIALVRVPFSPKWTAVPKWSVLGRLMVLTGASTIGELRGKKVTVLKQGERLRVL